MRTEDFVDFIVAREQHRIAKERGWKVFGGDKRGQVKPDPIISEYRFCNVRRNDDRVTKWIFKHILHPYADDERLWFYLVAARLFNLPNTLSMFFPLKRTPFDATVWRSKLKLAREKGVIFNGAYIVSTNGRAMDKVDYVIDCVLDPLWKARKFMSEQINSYKTLDEAHHVLMSVQGLGSFMAAQVLADLKYASPKARWKDFDTFAASGPGSRRGLNRVLGGPLAAPRPESDFRERLALLRDAANAMLRQRPSMKHLVPMTAQDIQNCLCEFDKYERARLGEGRPKQKYTPFEAPWEE